jgi:hypothetical protein
MKPTRPSLEEIKLNLNFDPHSGKFSWLGSKRGRGAQGCPAGTKDAKGRIRINIGGIKIFAHHIVWVISTGRWPVRHLDHINGNPSDNRFTNLREATPTQNMANKKMSSLNRTGLKGVGFDRRSKRFFARISAHGKRMVLGRFDTPEAAHLAYGDAARRLFGEFARLK